MRAKRLSKIPASRADAVRQRLAARGLTEKHVAAARDWARRTRAVPAKATVRDVQRVRP
jgi:hypothetical protein